MPHRRTPRVGEDESGIALLAVLLAITLLTITVVEFTLAAQVETRRARGTRNALQAEYLARSGVNFAEMGLLLDAQRERLEGVLGPANDSLHDEWALPFPPLPLGDGTILLRIRDETRFLNLNAVAAAAASTAGQLTANSTEREVFTELFNVLGLSPSLRSALFDWLDAGDEPELSPAGAEEAFYLGRTPPVAIPNGAIDSLHDLRSMRDVTPEILARLAEVVTVLPPAQASLDVNLNTAPAEVLFALAPDLLAEPSAVTRLIEARAQAPFDSESDVRTASPRFWEIWDAAHDSTNFDSEHFRIETIGTVGSISRGLTVVIKRTTDSIERLQWWPHASHAALTTPPPSDFLDELPPLGGG